MKIGIIAGMGAAAGAHFYSTLIKECQKRGCAADSDFPEVILHNIPSLATTEAGISDAEALTEEITEDLMQMNAFGPDFVFIACNSAHAQIESFRQMTKARIISLPESAVGRCASKYGVICSESSKNDGVYPASAMYPNEKEQSAVKEAIGAAMSGKDPEVHAANILAIINRMMGEGANNVILGCTELPLLGINSRFVIDPGLCAIEDALG